MAAVLLASQSRQRWGFSDICPRRVGILEEQGRRGLDMASPARFTRGGGAEPGKLNAAPPRSQSFPSPIRQSPQMGARFTQTGPERPPTIRPLAAAQALGPAARGVVVS
jgi:hypothetical protein